ncbi:hypothetical protein BDZ45DRAFT_670891 [Acephala macrosclerotiorum]|nr:hypothetical protein BDZ45DRAFT_670891 [Acephala macrosclerotiorum]
MDGVRGTTGFAEWFNHEPISVEGDPASHACTAAHTIHSCAHHVQATLKPTAVTTDLFVKLGTSENHDMHVFANYMLQIRHWVAVWQTNRASRRFQLQVSNQHNTHDHAGA